MNVINAVSTGQLQTVLHCLEELEAKGVKDLPAARQLISDVLHDQHLRLQQERGKVQGVKTKKHFTCPDCGKTLRFCSLSAAYVCRCGYSRLEER